ncbi:MAG: cation:proton antiporter [Phycisphaerales bacterium]|nr:cation:proton antiporter [Phycisphaerales bacterium]
MMPITLAATSVHPLLVDLVVILTTAALVSLLFSRLRLAAIPAYLVAGAIIGPSLIGLIPNAEHVESISQLAIILLMFGIGLHMDTAEIRGELAPIILIGAISCALVTAVGTPIAMAFGQPAPAALLIAAATAMSSTAAVMRLLQQRRQLRDLHGRVAFGTLIVQDLFAVLVLAVVPLLAAWQSSQGGAAEAHAAADPDGLISLGAKAAAGVFGIAAIVLAGRLLLPRLLHIAGKDGGTELVLIVGAGAAMGSAAITALLGFSPELGAFLAGFLLAATPARHQLLGQLAPVRDLFIPVFFVAVGLGLDLHAAVASWWVVLAVLGATLLVKAGAVAISAWACGMSGPVSVTSGIVLAQTGEFTLVVLGVGRIRGLISPGAEAILAAVVALSLMLTPWLFEAGPMAAGGFVRLRPPPWRRRAMRDLSARHPGEGSTKPRAIVAGYGPVGREVAARLERSGFECTIVELNPETVKRQRGLGRRIVYGDAANPEVLHEAGLEHCDAVLLTIPDHEPMLRACEAIRSMAPGVFIAVRSGFLSRGMQATSLGADLVVVDEIATATMMAAQVGERLRSRVPTPPATPGAS